MLYGGIIGDIIGSVYEWNNIKTKDFDLFNCRGFFTDDTVITLAIADGLINSDLDDEDDIKQNLIRSMISIGRRYPNCGYGILFHDWLWSPNHLPYNSFGNGSAMRVAPAAWIANDLYTTLRLAKNTAEVTHNHPQGIKGAQAVAAAIFLARQKKSKKEIKKYIDEHFYRLDFTLDEIRDSYTFDVTCQGSVPEAIVAFLESTSFEDAIRNAISIGGDSDTIGAITGSIAEAYYGVPEEFKEYALSKLDDRLLNILERFTEKLHLD